MRSAALGRSVVWQRWGLAHDPVQALALPFVATRTAQTATDRLCAQVESGGRLIRLQGEAGVGKTAVVRRSMTLLGGGRRRISVAADAGGWGAVAAALARCVSLAARESGADPWGLMDRVLRVAQLERAALVLVVERVTAQGDLDAELAALLARADARGVALGVILAERSEEGGLPVWDRADERIWLEPLTRDEAETFVRTKLAAAGASDSLFTDRAFTRLHAQALGNPRRLETLVRGCLLEGAAQGLEIIGPELVDALAGWNFVQPA